MLLEKLKTANLQNHSSDERLRSSSSTHSRRGFLTSLGSASATVLLLNPINALAKISPERHLAFYNTHTSEKLDIVYFSGGRYISDALTEIDQLFRDHRTDEVHPIDPGLFDILYGLSSLTKHSQTFQIISGYRSPATNALLRRRSKRVAKKSFHMRGQAADIRLPGVDTKRLRNMAISLQQGGVGYYRTSNFIHVDTGRVRRW